jgi:hypothetical protein
MDTLEFQQVIQKEKDKEHLNLLSIFYFITAGLAIAGIIFLFLYFSFLKGFILNRHHINQMSNIVITFQENSARGADREIPAEFYNIIALVFYFIGGIMVVNALLNLLTGFFLRQRKHRVFCIIIGTLNCLHVPIGTALGAFTIAVLTRDSVKQLFDDQNNIQVTGTV